jgi:uncharacterized protein (TIGR02001 family)
MPRFPRICALALVCAATPALADEGSAWSVEGSVSAMSDYVWRGVSQTQEDPAAQAELTLSHESGFYVGAFLSNVDFTGPDDEDDGMNTEANLWVGYNHEINDSMNLDVYYIRYFYPGVNEGFDIDFNEVTVALGFGGNYTASVSYSDDAMKLGGSSLYYSLAGEWELESGFTVGASVGYYDLDSAIDESYTDYGVSIGKSFGPMDVSLWYTNTSGFNEVLDENLGSAADGRVGVTLSVGF